MTTGDRLRELVLSAGLTEHGHYTDSRGRVWVSYHRSGQPAGVFVNVNPYSLRWSFYPEHRWTPVRGRGYDALRQALVKAGLLGQ